MSDNGRRVLAVDDDSSLLAVVEDIIGSAGYGIRVAETGAEALRQLETESFDLVITDLRMPEMSGQELVRRLRQHPTHKRIPILVLATGAEEAELGQLRVDMRIGKPFTPKTLLNAIAALIG